MPRFPLLDDEIPSIQACIDLINQFYWNISVINKDDYWLVKSGEMIILEAETQEQVDGFLYGMGLAYSVFPQDYVDRFREDFNPY